MMELFGTKFIDYAEKVYFPSIQKNIKSSSYAHFRWIYEKYLKQYWLKKNLKDITNHDVQKFYEYLATLNLSKSTITRGVLGVLRTILNDAARNGKMPALLIRLKTPNELYKKKEGKNRMLSELDHKKLMDILHEPLNKFIFRKAKVFSIIALCEGLRIGEICGLKWGDINFENKTITIKRTVNRVYDIEDEKSKINISSPKTENSERTIPMLDFAAEKLKEYKKICEDINEKFYINPEIEDFYVLGGVSPIEPRVLRADFQRFLNAYEIEYINPHGLRHTFCTTAINMGAPVNGVSKMLGHANEVITLGIYNHLTESKMRETTDILNQAINNVQDS